jgi:transcription elongation factor Elf1
MDDPEEVLRPAEQRPERSQRTYTAHLRCQNCGHRNDVTLPRGEAVTDVPCENCGVAGELRPAV